MTDGVDRSVDILWGARDIGQAIGLSPRRTFALLDGGHLPAKKVAGRWCARKSELLAHLSSGVLAESAPKAVAHG